MLPCSLCMPAADRYAQCPEASSCRLQIPGWRLHLLHKTQMCGHHMHALGCRFQLLACIHRARSSGTLEGRRQLVRVRLLAFYVLFQSSPSTEDLAAFFNQEPDFVSELAAVLRAESTVPEDVRWAVPHEPGCICCWLLILSTHAVGDMTIAASCSHLLLSHVLVPVCQELPSVRIIMLAKRCTAGCSGAGRWR